MSATTELLPYKDRTRSADERTADLLARMTLEEKVAQMVGVWRQKAALLVDEQGRFDAGKARLNFGHGRGLGQVGRPSDAGGGLGARAMAEFDQRDSAVLHRGVAARHPGDLPRRVPARARRRRRAPVSRSPSSCATFDAGLVERPLRDDRRRGAARGTHQALTPVVDVAASRDGGA